MVIQMPKIYARNCLPEVRSKKGYTQRKLAGVLDISPQWVNLIEKKKGSPSPELAKQIADLLSQDFESLFYFSSKQTKEYKNSSMSPTQNSAEDNPFHNMSEKDFLMQLVKMKEEDENQGISFEIPKKAQEEIWNRYHENIWCSIISVALDKNLIKEYQISSLKEYFTKPITKDNNKSEFDLIFGVYASCMEDLLSSDLKIIRSYLGALQQKPEMKFMEYFYGVIRNKFSKPGLSEKEILNRIIDRKKSETKDFYIGLAKKQNWERVRSDLQCFPKEVTPDVKTKVHANIHSLCHYFFEKFIKERFSLIREQVPKGGSIDKLIDRFIHEHYFDENKLDKIKDYTPKITTIKTEPPNGPSELNLEDAARQKRVEFLDRLIQPKCKGPSEAEIRKEVGPLMGTIRSTKEWQGYLCLLSAAKSINDSILGNAKKAKKRDIRCFIVYGFGKGGKRSKSPIPPAEWLKLAAIFLDEGRRKRANKCREIASKAKKEGCMPVGSPIHLSDIQDIKLTWYEAKFFVYRDFNQLTDLDPTRYDDRKRARKILKRAYNQVLNDFL